MRVTVANNEGRIVDDGGNNEETWGDRLIMFRSARSPSIEARMCSDRCCAQELGAA